MKFHETLSVLMFSAFVLLFHYRGIWTLLVYSFLGGYIPLWDTSVVYKTFEHSSNIDNFLLILKVIEPPSTFIFCGLFVAFVLLYLICVLLRNRITHDYFYFLNIVCY